MRSSTRSAARSALSLALLSVACGRLGYDLTDLPPPGANGDATGASGRGGATGGSPGIGGSSAGGTSGASAGGTGGALPSSGGARSDSGAGGAAGTGAATTGSGGISSDSGARGDAAQGSGGRGTDAATDGRGGASDARAPAEAAADAGFPSCSITHTWSQSFDSDPTQSDNDHDGTKDWVVRSGAAFPVSELSGGVWRTAGASVALDSRPNDDFSARTLVDVRFRHPSVPASNRGAVFWVNLNEGGPVFSALFASLVGTASGGQELTLYGKTGTTEVPIAVFPNLSNAFVDLHLDVDPVAKSVSVWIAGSARGTFTIPDTGAPNADSFATVVSWEGQSEFDSVLISVCTP